MPSLPEILGVLGTGLSLALLIGGSILWLYRRHIRTLQRQIRTLTRENQQLKAETKECQTKLQVTEQEAAKLLPAQQRIEELSQHWQHSQDEAKRMCEHAVLAESAKTQTTELLEKLQIQAEQQQAEARQTEATLTAQVEQLQQEQEQQAAEVARILQESAQLRQLTEENEVQLAQQTDRLVTQQEEIALLLERTQSLEAAVVQLQEHGQQLALAKSQVEQQLVAAQQTEEALRTQQQNLEQQLTAAQETEEALRSQLQKVEQQLVTAQQTEGSLRAQIQKLQDQAKLHQAKPKPPTLPPTQLPTVWWFRSDGGLTTGPPPLAFLYLDNSSPQTLRLELNGLPWRIIAPASHTTTMLRPGSYTLRILVKDTGTELDRRTLEVAAGMPYVLNLLGAQVYTRGVALYGPAAGSRTKEADTLVTEVWFQANEEYLFQEPPAAITVPEPTNAVERWLQRSYLRRGSTNSITNPRKDETAKA